jgi:L-threonylcarbamoyladenylate synthase
MIEEYKTAAEFLAKGKIILYPTDTIWGIGCDATNSKAVRRIYEIKRRQDQKSLIILLDEPGKLAEYVDKVPPSAYDLIARYQSPLTIIYPRAKNLAENVVADDGSIGIRIVRDEFCRLMIHELGKPVVSTSANLSGEPAPIVFGKIGEAILGQVDYTVLLHRDMVRSTKPSTIIRLRDDGEFEVVRK